MKQLLIMEIINGEERHRSKALKIVVGVPGFESVSLQGEDKNQIAVIGERLDAVNIMNILRKKIKLVVKLISVSPMDDDDDSDDGIVAAPEDYHQNYYPPPPYQAIVPDNYGYGHRPNRYDYPGYRPNHYDYPGYRPNHYDYPGYRPNNPDNCTTM